MPKLVDGQGRPITGQMPGLVEGLVTDNEDPDSMGRVRVKFPTLPEMPESYWARVVTPMAGKQRGWVTLPEIDDEVLVAFMHGDFNNAIVLGALFNGEDTPPYANDDGNNDLRVFQSRSGHRVTFDDCDGSERVELITHNEEVKVIWDSSGKTLAVYAGDNIILEAGSTMSMKCSDFVVEASGSVDIQAGSSFTLSASSSATIDGGGTLTLSAGTISIN
jgi:phage baseplate assembly protein V